MITFTYYKCMNKPRIALTSGEPAGIGPDLCLMVANSDLAKHIVILADADLLQQRAKHLKLDFDISIFDPQNPSPPPHGLCVLHTPLNAPVVAGELNTKNSEYVLHLINQAVCGCQSGLFDAMVTAPVHKGVINDANIKFSGHTEYIAKLTSAKPVMMLATPGLRVALATTHLPLADVPNTITQPSLTQIINILHTDLEHKFNIASPTILVCGLNPHAGESGHLGREEIDVIIPVISSLQKKGMNVQGPFPADTLFNPDYLQQADAILAMYHDQGLPVLKYKGFGNAVNITLGLPIIRTSVDHGTALDLAASGQADCGSLQYALQTAFDLATSL